VGGLSDLVKHVKFVSNVLDEVIVHVVRLSNAIDWRLHVCLHCMLFLEALKGVVLFVLVAVDLLLPFLFWVYRKGLLVAFLIKSHRSLAHTFGLLLVHGIALQENSLSGLVIIIP
jgi:hypothetical protein